MNKRYGSYIANVDSINFETYSLEDLNPAIAIGDTAEEAILNLAKIISNNDKYYA